MTIAIYSVANSTLDQTHNNSTYTSEMHNIHARIIWIESNMEAARHQILWMREYMRMMESTMTYLAYMATHGGNREQPQHRDRYVDGGGGGRNHTSVSDEYIEQNGG